MEVDPELSQSQEPVRRIARRSLSRMAIVALLLGALGLVIYRDFVFGEKTVLYTDIGSDSVNISYPLYVLLSEYLRHVGIPSWSFQVGMGQNLFPYVGAVLVNPVVWLAKGLIAKALVYQHLLYVVISGVLFASFLADRRIAFTSCLLGAVLLSFSAYMCMGSCWYFHANELVCFTFLLFATEQAVGPGRWLCLVLAVALVGLFSVFHLFLCALFLSFYVPVRLIERYSWQPRPILKTSLRLAGAAILGVGLIAIVALDSFYLLLNSPRGSSTTSVAAQLSSFPIFGFESTSHYLTAVLRPFANDMVGTGSNFRGWQNYLEAPMSYCGLVCLLILPQVFVKATKRERILYAAVLGLLTIPVVFPWFRYLFWGFQGDYYRTFSLFSIFGVITLSMTAFSRFIGGQRLNLWLLWATLAILLGVLYLPIAELRPLLNPTVRVAATTLLIGYGGLLTIGKLLGQQRIVAWLIVTICVLELIYFDGITVGNRPTVTKQELKERVGYNDATVEAIRDINANDHDFFRVTKTWGSGLAQYISLNDAMVFGYYGTSSYSSFNNLNYVRFLIALDAIPPENLSTETHWSLGLLGQPLLSTFAGEKYVLTNDPVPFQTDNHYETIKDYGGVYVFRNKLFVPFGLCFDRYIPEDQFLRLPSGVKAPALFHAVVLPDKRAGDGYGLSELTIDEFKEQLAQGSIPDVIAARRSNALQLDSFKQTRIEGTIHLDKKSVLVLQTPFDPGWMALQDGVSAPVLKVDCGLLGVALDSGEHKVQLRYRPPLMVQGAIVSVASLLLLAVGLRRWPRIVLPAVSDQ